MVMVFNCLGFPVRAQCQPIIIINCYGKPAKHDHLCIILEVLYTRWLQRCWVRLCCDALDAIPHGLHEAQTTPSTVPHSHAHQMTKLCGRALECVILCDLNLSLAVPE